MLIGATIPLTSCSLFKAKKYTVTFDAQMEGVFVKDQIVEKNNTAVNPKVDDHNGQTLVGWFTEASCKPENAYDFNSYVTKNITLYGKWIPSVQVREVKFHCNKIGVDDITLKVEYNTLAHEPKVKDPKDQEVIKEWHKNNLQGDIFDFSTPITENIELYAVWTDEKHTVTFDTVSESGADVPPVQVVFYNKHATEPNMKEIQATHRVVEGWYTDNSLGSDKKFDFSTPITKDLTLYAKWVDASQLFTVTFNYNYENAPTTVTQKVLKGECAVPVKDPVREHYKFDYWYQIDSSKAFDFATPITANTNLFAHWTGIASHTVTFSTGNGSKIDSQTIYDGDVVSKPQTDPTKSNSEFVCWCSDAAFANKYDFTTPVKDNLTLYAKWNTHPTALKVCNRSGEEISKLELYTGDVKHALRVDTLWSNGTETENVELDTNNYTITYKSGDKDTVSFDDNHYITVNKAGSATYEIASTDSKCTVKKELVIDTVESYSKYLSFSEVTIDGVEGYEVSGKSKTEIPENLVIPSTFNSKPVLAIAENGFDEYTTLKTVSLPNTIKQIKKNAFHVCDNLEYINLPEGLTTISDGAFNCMNHPGKLQNISFPTTLTTLGSSCFSYQNALKTIYIPKTITSLGSDLFAYCPKLTSVNLEEGMPTALPGFMFYACSSLKTISVPEGVTTVGQSVFAKCASLESLSLPSTLTDFGGGSGNMPIEGCDKLKSFTVPMTNKHYYAWDTTEGKWSTTGNVLCKVIEQESDDSSIVRIGSNVVNLVIPATVKYLDQNCCENSSTLQTISFKDDGILQKISYSAFSGCSKLESINFTNCAKLQSIEGLAFFNCTKLNTILFPTSGENINLGSSSFSGCTSLETITITSTITSIQDKAFINCTALKRMYFGSAQTTWKSVTLTDNPWTTEIDTDEDKGTSGPNATYYLNTGCNHSWSRQ